MRSRTRTSPVPLQVPPPTNQPTAERRRHAEAIDVPDVDGRAFRPGWLVRTRLGGMRRDGEIDAAVYEAAEAFRRDYEAVARTPGSPLSRLGMPRAPIRVGVGDGAGGRIAAAARLRRIRERIGSAAYALVILVVIEDMSWPELGRRIGCGHKAAKRRAVTAIQALVPGSQDDSGRAAR